MGQTCLVDELRKHIGKTVCIGVRSSFFFIGPADEAIKDIRLLGMMSKLCVAIASRRSIGRKALKSAVSSDIGERIVQRVYNRNPNNDEKVIIVEGGEFGAFWNREEYIAGRKVLVGALSAAGLGGSLAEN